MCNLVYARTICGFITEAAIKWSATLSSTNGDRVWKLNKEINWITIVAWCGNWNTNINGGRCLWNVIQKFWSAYEARWANVWLLACGAIIRRRWRFWNGRRCRPWCGIRHGKRCKFRRAGRRRQQRFKRPNSAPSARGAPEDIVGGARGCNSSRAIKSIVGSVQYLQCSAW